MFGGGKFYGPEIIMKSQDMILVTINYRLGVLGFLSTEDEVIPGNFGLKDQVEALKWVQRNIGEFNGDPSQVTITGFSAGGASVQLHYLSPLTDGLFNNGISHSGNALNPWVMMENGKQKAHQVADYMNCSSDHASLLACLREKPAENLVMLAKKFQPFMYNPFSPFGVSVEPESDSAFLTDSPLNLLKQGKFKNLPWLLSQTQDEGLYPASEFYDDAILKQINDEWNELAPFILDFNGTTADDAEKLKISKEIRKFYLGNREISKDNFKPFLQVRARDLQLSTLTS
jgi:carboxylesterase type B